jgi:hypothetical protein
MKIYKNIDFTVQAFFITGGILYCILVPDNFYYPYFFVGGWQLLSCLAHGIFPDFYPHSGRASYLWALFFVILLGLISLLIPGSILAYLMILLIISPIMAVRYCYVCYKELKLYQQKEWVQLR